MKARFAGYGIQENSEGPNITPLIDVVFILLIFFVVSTTFIKDMSLKIERPVASTAASISGKELRVYIDNQNNLYVNGEPVRIWILQGKLRDLLRSTTNKTVLVVSDKDVKVERLIEVVDQCRFAGAKDVAAATKAEVG
jgi:biopolymer transport protein ExbD